MLNLKRASNRVASAINYFYYWSEFFLLNGPDSLTWPELFLSAITCGNVTIFDCFQFTLLFAKQHDSLGII